MISYIFPATLCLLYIKFYALDTDRPVSLSASLAMDEKNYKEDVGLLDDSFQYDPPRLPTVNRWPYQRAILFAMAIGLLLSTCLNLFLLFRVFTDPGQHSYGFKFPEAFYCSSPPPL